MQHVAKLCSRMAANRIYPPEPVSSTTIASAFDEADLVAKAKAGDADAFTDLVEPV